MTDHATTTPAVLNGWTGPALLVPIAFDAVLLSAKSYNGQWSWVPPCHTDIDVLLGEPDQHLFQNISPSPINPHGNSQADMTGCACAGRCRTPRQRRVRWMRSAAGRFPTRRTAGSSAVLSR